jgi:hypothetical protein
MMRPAMNTVTSPFVIFSAEKADCTPTLNEERTRELAGQLEGNGIAYTPVSGMYEGKEEHSFLVKLSGIADYTLDQIARTCYRYGQDCILYVDHVGHASMIDTSKSARPDYSKAVHMGVWWHVWKNYAVNKPSYSVIDGEYYTVLNT